ncbi:uncharacterized protein LOC123888155 [Trifolium pratense]|uniref:uncharacterized protein LOC123888155 n=1 Tax=Trifolium pratense TaxID=57577 RepID=UPI001E693295|nr:uncharacterized protein LOC123888155 [Trifolium pratense]
MESPTRTSQKIKGLPIKKRGIPDLLQNQFLTSLDLNQPAQIELQDQYNFEVEPSMMEIQKGSIVESKVNENIDPLQKFSSSSRLSYDNLQNAMRFKTLDFELGGNTKHDLPSIGVMGCTFYLMFVIASKADPKCPRCKKNLMVIDNV